MMAKRRGILSTHKVAVIVFIVLLIAALLCMRCFQPSGLLKYMNEYNFIHIQIKR